MTYQKTLDFLYSKLPMFTRVGAVAFKKDLHNTLALCNALDNPQNKFKTLHIAGTNGKGSTSHMLAAILQEAGYKTGLYTSPHLKDFRERIRVNGKMASKAFVQAFVKGQKQLIETIEPSFFEATVAMAFDYFAQEKVDIAVIEVGLGGRLDSTNIITPELSIITNISLDHTNILGDTLPQIAFEKAGIIKKNIPVVIGETHSETQPVFAKKAKAENAPIYFAAAKLHIANVHQKGAYLVVDVFEGKHCILPQLALDLTGTYQLKNILTVIESVIQLRKQGYAIPNQAIYKALKNVKKLTDLQGRWQTVSKNPLVICDTGHNKAGITEVLQNIKNTAHEQLHMVIGMVKDKDISGVLALLPKEAIYYFCQPQLERALDATELAQQAAAFGLQGKTFASVALALADAKQSAGPKDLIFVGGSTFVVAEMI
ncbi:folylpolyglutamate synthase/dihydrofolate synthase family protein [Pedobacter sp. KR3-3]|uniref:Dihydrofolate synthase/folylpolyglutamate synthase n=1 Tax=Pedobacter albus TaxID=3113905 RepID=A0ABU7I1X9_9SPHI|nr:folylpolyglutamate synthase/dihydrofolate synthase family protein [Pedobacter sp. KR3-3]MEE1943471.1 folylpolyglutamate synthase/dihydrofolate synthase family protein [Pedobacter sp. KR3-3]